jgi:hypothetical protein
MTGLFLKGPLIQIQRHTGENAHATTVGGAVARLSRRNEKRWDQAHGRVRGALTGAWNSIIVAVK